MSQRATRMWWVHRVSSDVLGRGVGGRVGSGGSLDVKANKGG